MSGEIDDRVMPPVRDNRLVSISGHIGNSLNTTDQQVYHRRRRTDKGELKIVARIHRPHDVIQRVSGFEVKREKKVASPSVDAFQLARVDRLFHVQIAVKWSGGRVEKLPNDISPRRQSGGLSVRRAYSGRRR